MTSRATDRNHIPELVLMLDEAQDEYLENLGEAMLEQIDQGFDKGQDALGNSWESLDPDTVAAKGNADILEETGAFRESFTAQVDNGENSVAIGSNSPLINYHEMGTSDIPRRPVLGPAATWANEKLIVPMGKEVIGERIDEVTF